MKKEKKKYYDLNLFESLIKKPFHKKSFLFVYYYSLVFSYTVIYDLKLIVIY